MLKNRSNTGTVEILSNLQGQKYAPEKIERLKNDAALKKVTSLDDCVAAFVMLAKNTSMTGMRIQVDAGLEIRGA